MFGAIIDFQLLELLQFAIIFYVSDHTRKLNNFEKLLSADWLNRFWILFQNSE